MEKTEIIKIIDQAMLDHGYTIVWQPNGRHGWAMRLHV